MFYILEKKVDPQCSNGISLIRSCDTNLVVRLPTTNTQ